MQYNNEEKVAFFSKVYAWIGFLTLIFLAVVGFLTIINSLPTL